MFEIEVIQQVRIPTLSEETLKEVLTEALASHLPAGVVINQLDFVVKRKGGQEVTLEVDAQFAGSEPLKATAPKAEPEVKAAAESKPIELPEADDVPEPDQETEVTRDGIPNTELSFEETQANIIDEVLAEDAEEEEEEPAPTVTEGKSLSELFGS